MGKFHKTGDGKARYGETSGPGGGASNAKEGGNRRKEYNGLKVLGRGSNTNYKGEQKAKLWADKKHADKKRAALSRLLRDMPDSEVTPISGVFDEDGAQAKPHAKSERKPHSKSERVLREPDSTSSSDCSLSDEEVGDGDIVFKDDLLQRAWDPASLPKVAQSVKPPAGGDADRSDRSEKGKGGKATKAERLAGKAAREGPASVGSFMDVPDWDDADGEGERDGKMGEKRKGGKMKATLPEKITFGDKKRPEVLSVLARKADDNKKQLEQERKAAQQAREKAQRDKDLYYKKRHQDKKQHLKRTGKGQPVTKHLISNILEKLQKE